MVEQELVVLQEESVMNTPAHLETGAFRSDIESVFSRRRWMPSWCGAV
jgi:hypothetical protein